MIHFLEPIWNPEIQKAQRISAKPLKSMVPQEGLEHIYVSALNYADVNKKGNNYNN